MTQTVEAYHRWLVAGGNACLATGYPWGTFPEEELAELEAQEVAAGAVRTVDLCRTIVNRDACMDAANATVTARNALIAVASRRRISDRIAAEAAIREAGDAAGELEPIR